MLKVKSESGGEGSKTDGASSDGRSDAGLFEAAVEPPGRKVAIAGRKKTPPVFEEKSAGGESEEGELFLKITVKQIDDSADLV